MSSIAIITARGGSKRIPKKNIKDFCGKPIIVYSIDAAIKSGVFDEVMVSTDSEEIADIAEQYGANVPFLRSDKASNDFATTADVIAEVLKAYKTRGQKYDYFACIYPTAPFVTAVKLADAMNSLKEKGADALVSVVRYSFPPQRGFVINEEYVKYQFPQYERTRSQDLEPIYHDCGQFYICSCEKFLNMHTLILPRTIPYIVNEEEVQDIDTTSDWNIAEAKYVALHQEEYSMKK